MAERPQRRRVEGGDVHRDRPVKRGEPTPAPAPDSLAALDRLIHERVRLGIVSALAVNDSLTFQELKEILAVTDGNLSVHARRLEEAGYIACKKSFAMRIPRSEYRLTQEGRKALERHLEHLAAVIRWARS